MANNLSLREQVSKLPDKPGCYIYYNIYNQVLYVGKAKNLKIRVSSYFNKVYNYKTTRLVNEIDHFETIITNTEKEALILEHNLIKQYKPKYNILLSDDKHYPYIVITKERDPQYLYVRNISKKYACSYGPFPEGSHAREIIKILERLYPLRRCKGNLGKPCLYYHINQCSGACFKKVPREYYEEMIQHVDEFFKGNTRQIKALLTKKMHQTASNLQFEEANKIKLLIHRLDWTISDQNVDFLNKSQNVDIVGLFQTPEMLVITVLFYRLGKLSYKDSDYFMLTKDDDPQEIIRLYLQNIYQKNILPKKIIIDPRVDLTELALLYPKIFKHPKNTNDRHVMKLAIANSQESYLQYQKYHHHRGSKEDLLLELKNLLKLPEIPYLIEMFDIANINDEFVTGGVITYKNGLPSRNDYRKYNIEISYQDDYHRITNLVFRRYQHAKAEKRALPNLIIMDGGIQQVNACLKQLDILDLQIPVIGLVKNEHHRTDHLLNLDKKAINLDKSSKLFHFLTKMQDDVHNFTIRNFRTRQTKALITSVLDQVPGLGQTKICQLNQSFGSLNEIKAATDEQLYNILKNKTTVENLKKFLASFDK
ncbi:hypothetical protein P344_04070 [Spiroplasma mirum ATCC 29335]|uniref:UvrABC system protein C n=1 Tax=Spiroplasma mirum ATCC 29335 TaxID=838561 RepID=W6ALT1_9MOLU|nr:MULTISPECIES: excinuclease ABC subunit UvrC [Spiroplasma]AHI58142.1 hypothetical protein P344_04070 [Spiroplasma mirum ATCC 29335]AKM53194.1 excinuclease ABC subunit C [Spiroplasma atrichopogonis]